MLLLMPHGVIISLPASHQYFLPMQPRIALSTLATWLDWEPISSQLSSVKPFLGCCLLKYNPKSYHWYLHKNIPAYTVPSAAIQPHVKRRIIQGSPDCCAIRYLWRAALYHLPPCFLQPGPLGCIRTPAVGDVDENRTMSRHFVRSQWAHSTGRLVSQI